MGQYTVIIVLSAILLGGVILFNARSSTSAASTELSAYQADRIAREASQVALRDVVRELNARPDDWTNNLTIAKSRFDTLDVTYEVQDEDGDVILSTTYDVELSEMYLSPIPAHPDTLQQPDRVRLRVNGAFESWSEAAQSIDTTNYVVEAVYERGYTNFGVPPSMRSSIVTDRTLELQGSNNIYGSTHSNGRTIDTGGNGLIISGSGTYTTSPAPSADHFQGGVSFQDSIYVPTVAIPPTSGITHTINGNTNFSSNETVNFPAAWFVADPSDPNYDGGYGTEGAPYVLYVNGNLRINASIRLLGHVRIYVNGNLEIRNNATIAPTTASVFQANNSTEAEMRDWITANMPDGGTISFFARSIAFQGTPFIGAHLYVDGPLDYGGGGNRIIVGGVTAKGDIEMSGNAKIIYTEPNASILDPGINRNVPEGLRLVAYREWAERP